LNRPKSNLFNVCSFINLLLTRHPEFISGSYLTILKILKQVYLWLVGIEWRT